MAIMCTMFKPLGRSHHHDPLGCTDRALHLQQGRTVPCASQTSQETKGAWAPRASLSQQPEHRICGDKLQVAPESCF